MTTQAGAATSQMLLRRGLMLEYATLAWNVVGVVVPAGISADTSGRSLRVAYLLAVSQALALGPLIGSPRRGRSSPTPSDGSGGSLKPYTERWKWWIAANLVSYLVVYAITYLL